MLASEYHEMENLELFISNKKTYLRPVLRSFSTPVLP